MQGLDLMDSGAFDSSDWDQRLPPPAAKAAVQTLTVVVISTEQAGAAASRLRFVMGGGVLPRRSVTSCGFPAADSQWLCVVVPDKGVKCPVCLLEFEEQETVRQMPCKHLFHCGCILPWLGKVTLLRR